MSSHSSHRNVFHSRSYHSVASINSPDSGQLYGSSRGMGPPPLDYSAPQPIEIDLSNSTRTLPSPSMSGSNSWDILQPQPHGLGDGPYGPSHMSRMQQLPLEGQARGDPIYNWYAGNDGPWTPSGIVAPSEEKLQSRQISTRNPIPYGSHYRQPNPSDAGSIHYGVAPSDSGYGTRQSVGNTSIFSGDVAERDQDCRSLAGHVENYQPFQGFNEIGQQRESRTSIANETWDHSGPTSTGSDSPGLICPTCNKAVKTQSELKKHDLRHRKPFKCQVQGCTRADGFSTTNDLDRHTRSKHPSALSESIPTKKFRCHVPGCKSKDKTWPRLDNFRSHLKRVHSHHLITDEDFEDMIRRAEFWEKPNFEVDQDSLFSQRSFQDSPRAGISPHENLSNFRRPELDWKVARLYPDVLSPPEAPMAPMAPKVTQLDKFEAKPVPPEERSAVPEACHPDTVQPLQVFQPPTEVPENKFTLESVLAPASTGSAVEITNRPSPNPAAQSKPQGKATRQTDVSAADAVVAEVIRTALSGAGSPDLANDRVLTQDMKRNSLPNGKTTTGSSWSSSPNPAISSRGRTTSHINLVDSPSPEREIDEAHVRKATAQVLKNLQDRGYTIRRDRSASPRIQNPGSVASNKSENQVTCQKCRKFRGRPCELKKHMKRHERPYGCTFLTCNKTFGSKNDWKRHENSQHFQLETWRCDEERPEGGACAKVCYRKQTFQEHLSKEHQISDTAPVNEKLEACRIGRNCQARFWCGFCTKLVELKKKGLEAWTERFDHIDDHFMGRHNWPKQGIQDWIPVDSDKPKGDSTSDIPAGKEGHDSGPDPSGSGSPSGTSPDASGAPGGSSADAIIPGTDRPGSPKRKHSSGDENSRPQKHLKTATNVETTIYCCQCKIGHNPNYHRGCTNCDDGHEFCQYCRMENLHV